MDNPLFEGVTQPGVSHFFAIANGRAAHAPPCAAVDALSTAAERASARGSHARGACAPKAVMELFAGLGQAVGRTSRKADCLNHDSFGPFRKCGHRVEDVVQLVGVGIFLPTPATTPGRQIARTAVIVDRIKTVVQGLPSHGLVFI